MKSPRNFEFPPSKAGQHPFPKKPPGTIIVFTRFLQVDQRRRNLCYCRTTYLECRRRICDNWRLFARIAHYCFHAFCLARLPGEANYPIRNLSRTPLRRAIPSFSVEVRRRSKLGTTASPNVQLPEAKPLQGASVRESHRAAAAVFEAKKVDQAPIQVEASRPKGQILQSLVPDQPLTRPLPGPSDFAAETDYTNAKAGFGAGAKRQGSGTETTAGKGILVWGALATGGRFAGRPPNTARAK